MSIAPTESLAGRYRVLRTLASGGMGTVLLAEDERLGRRVAIKRMRAQGTASEGLQRFRREARIGASLTHRNLVRIYDAIVEGPEIMIVMEYVPGRSLAELLREGRPDRATAVAILRDTAAGLDHAHEHGVVHRDVKPGNILLTEDGHAKLGDLGIATAAESTRITTTGSVLGTAAYLAPEQLDGRPATRASDVYSLAAVAYELLGGRRARSGRTPLEIVRQVAAGPPPDVCDLDPTLPAPACDVLRRGLSPDPAERPPSAGALAEELARELEAVGRPAPAREPVPVAVPAARADAPTHVTPAPFAARRAAAPVGPRRLLPVLALAAVVAAVAALALTAGLGDGGRAGDERASSEPPPVQRDDGEARDSSTSGGGSGASGAGAPAAPSGASEPRQAPAGDPGAAAAPAPAAGGTPGADPAGAVRGFYERIAADDFDGAWALAGDGVRAQWGNRRSAFAADTGLRSLQSIEFRRLEVTSQTASQATVAIRTEARHPARTDRCGGTISTVRGADGWLVGRLNVACR